MPSGCDTMSLVLYPTSNMFVLIELHVFSSNLFDEWLLSGTTLPAGQYSRFMVEDSKLHKEQESISHLGTGLRFFADWPA